MYQNIAARIPNELDKDINYFVKEEKTDKSMVIRTLLAEAVKKKLLDLALSKYIKREVSLGRAAEISRLPLADFMLKAADTRITMNYSVEELEKDFKTALKAR